jgi:hypothetical protein
LNLLEDDSHLLATEILDRVNGKKAELLTLQGTIEDHPAVFLIDSGASYDYISQGFTSKFGIPIFKADTKAVKIADGTI